MNGLVYHLGLHGCEVGSVTVVRHGVEDGVLDENAEGSAYEGGEEVNVDVISRAVEPSLCEKKNEGRDVRVSQ